MITIILCFILFIPIYFILFRQYKNPKDSVLWGRKWMYKEQNEVSEAAVRYSKVVALFGMIFITVLFLFLFLSQI
ncbi:hypothetical protein MHH70_10880 [Metasolibacillus sp. FSL H7-0170]|uniref:hypothetical protein n=1 Tax=Metasolibacillus sp. FSL H7-0170 TaxID=2921431 RepID=UPI0031585173